MQDLLLPDGHKGTPDTFYLSEDFYRRNGLTDMLPGSLRGRFELVNGRGEALDLAYRLGGRAARPGKPVALLGANGRTLTIIPGAGEVEAAELEDLTLAQQEKPAFDFVAWRERRGYPTREAFDSLFRQALLDRMEQHRRNPRTDPAPVRINRPKGNVYATS